MINAQLIDMLSKHPLNAEVLIWDDDVSELVPITGCVAGNDPTQAGKYIIELCSDTMQG